jgi:hypothetical protein
VNAQAPGQRNRAGVWPPIDGICSAERTTGPTAAPQGVQRCRQRQLHADVVDVAEAIASAS